MPAVEQPTLSKIIRTGWKQLANADQSDADEMLAITKQVLEQLETLEEAETTSAK